MMERHGYRMMENKFVFLNQTNYEYDVHSLVKAFFPEEQIKVVTEEKRFGSESFFLEIMLGQTGAKVQYGEEEFCWEYGGTQDNHHGQDNKNNQNDNAIEGQDKAYKNEFKRFLYRTLSTITNKTLPWGNLTGIRPTKLAYGMLDAGKEEKEVLSFLQKEHYVSEEKALLSIEIAKLERELLQNVHYEGGYSLYIGIPFCPTTCLYCSFTSYPIAAYRKLTETYVEALVKELTFVAEHFGDRILDSVYIGGGTPTTLEPRQLERLLSCVREKFDFSKVQEFTVEAGRADSITEEKLQVLKRFGVGRISVNPQTMKQETLDAIGRKASVKQVLEAYALARKVGFDNINMDLILGLPGELEEDVQNTIDQVVQLDPDSLTVHSLAIKRASKLNQWIQENGVSMLHNTDETMEIAATGAKRLGMSPYYLYRQKNMSGNFENVGYAKPGKLGLYNILIMEEKQTIVACGAGSITKRVFTDGRIERCDNVKDVALYIEKIEEMLERKKKLFAEDDFGN